MKFLAMISAMLLIVACGSGNENAAVGTAVSSDTEQQNVDVVLGLMNSFNAHDPDAMKLFWADDVTWYEIADGQSSVITSSAAQLYTELVSYFEAYPDVKSKLDSISVNGNFVMGIETPVWEQEGESKSQSSIVVYELEDQKVKRFWYYPPQ